MWKEGARCTGISQHMDFAEAQSELKQEIEIGVQESIFITCWLNYLLCYKLTICAILGEPMKAIFDYSC